jgi:hypothetical protein
MARGFGYETPDDWDNSENRIWDQLVSGDEWMGGDPVLQELFDTSFLNPDVTTDERRDAYDELVEYMWNEYGVDFEDVFDWEDYRVYYDG